MLFRMALHYETLELPELRLETPDDLKAINTRNEVLAFVAEAIQDAFFIGDSSRLGHLAGAIYTLTTRKPRSYWTLLDSPEARESWVTSFPQVPVSL